jgi:peptidoglycan/xylan/chitin deacetylase (PgdA/CDA1 family)
VRYVLRVRLTAAIIAATAAWALSAGAVPASASTTISLTFTSEIDDQYSARAILAAHNMHGTFYINSGRVGNAGRLNWTQVSALASDGNEIGAQGFNNTILTGLAPAELQHQVCDDRTALANRGYAPVSFAYPSGQHDGAAEAMVQQCGYASGRTDTGLGGVGQPKAEAIPPANPYTTRTRRSVDAADTVAKIQGYISDAEAAGNGWLQLAFTNVCDPGVTPNCPSSRITPSDLTTLLNWLQARNSAGTHVKTVREVMTGTQQPPPPSSAPGTAVSLTFDDARDNQLTVQPMLAAHNMQGTFYINSGHIGNAGRFTWADVASLSADGNEIAGHTVNHPHLPTLSPAEQQAEICDDRQALIDQGYNPISFAYPYGDHDAISEGLVEQCGYLSGRSASGIGAAGAPKAESIPPANPWVVRTRASVDVNDTLAEVEGWIMDAELVANGWIPLVFHHICDPNVEALCPDNHMTPDDFDALLDWLQSRQANDTNVKTIGEVMTEPPPVRVDTEAPVSKLSCHGAPCGVHGDSVRATLSATDTGGSGLKEIRFTLDGSLPTGFSPVYTGAIPITRTTRIRWFVTDNAGNFESPKFQTVTIRTCAALRKKLARAKAALRKARRADRPAAIRNAKKRLRFIRRKLKRLDC